MPLQSACITREPGHDLWNHGSYNFRRISISNNNLVLASVLHRIIPFLVILFWLSQPPGVLNGPLTQLPYLELRPTWLSYNRRSYRITVLLGVIISDTYTLKREHVCVKFISLLFDVNIGYICCNRAASGRNWRVHRVHYMKTGFSVCLFMKPVSEVVRGPSKVACSVCWHATSNFIFRCCKLIASVVDSTLSIITNNIYGRRMILRWMQGIKEGWVLPVLLQTSKTKHPL